MLTFAADLHVHTALSPCAADEMTPPRIVQAACERGLGLIAICDHNAAGNVAACQAAAERHGASRDAAANHRSETCGTADRSETCGTVHRSETGATDLAVLAGIEITTAEEVHVVGIFPDAAAAQAVAGVVQATLPAADDDYYRRFGEQLVLDAAGRLAGVEDRMLAMASALDLGAVVRLIHEHGGLAIAAHVDRPAFGVLRQLGVFPHDAGFDAVEVFTPAGQTLGQNPERSDGSPLAADTAVAPDRTADPAVAPGRAADTAVAPRGLEGVRLPVLASSDAHHLADIGRAATRITAREPSFAELVLALRGDGGRGVARA